MTDFIESWSSSKSIPTQKAGDAALSHALASSLDSHQKSSTCQSIAAADPRSVPMLTKHKIMWTPEMENTALELYVRAVQEGKRSENGFVPDTHRSVARQLNDLFPNVDLDEKKVKSKYNQGFKRDYDTLKVLRSTGGFEWDDSSCEIIAPDEIWNLHLTSYPQSKKFRNNPYPQSRQLELLFGPFIPFSTRLESVYPPIAGPSSTNLRNHENNFAYMIDSSVNSEGATVLSDPRSRSRSPTRTRPQFSTSVDQIMVSTDLSQGHSFSELTKVEQAVDQLQEEFSHLLNDMELLKALSILESDTKAQVFLRLRSHDLRIRWLQQQFHLHREC